MFTNWGLQLSALFGTGIPGSISSAILTVKSSWLYLLSKVLQLFFLSFIKKQLFSNCVFRFGEIHITEHLPCQSHSFSSLIIKYNIKFSSITLEKTEFLINYARSYLSFFKFSVIMVNVDLRGRNSFSSSGHFFYLFPVKPQIIAFRSQDINLFF